MRGTVSALLVLALATPALAATQAARSLYDRLGGKPAISAVVDEFVARVAADERVNKKVGQSDVPRLKFRLAQQLMHLTGGPAPDVPRSMTRVHKHMGVTDGEFDAAVEDLIGALDKFKVPEREKSEILGALGPLRSQIVEVHSRATGTPLPANFKPVGPLYDSEKRKVEEYERKHARH